MQEKWGKKRKRKDDNEKKINKNKTIKKRKLSTIPGPFLLAKGVRGKRENDGDIKIEKDGIRGTATLIVHSSLCTASLHYNN